MARHLTGLFACFSAVLTVFMAAMLIISPTIPARPQPETVSPATVITLLGYMICASLVAIRAVRNEPDETP